MMRLAHARCAGILHPMLAFLRLPEHHIVNRLIIPRSSPQPYEYDSISQPFVVSESIQEPRTSQGERRSKCRRISGHSC